MDAKPTTRSEVHYEGNVQGVGFRFTAQSIARRYGMAGYVQNLPDGRVRLVVEGGAPDVSAFLEDVSKRMGEHIHHQSRTDSAANGEFTRFEVRR